MRYLLTVWFAIMLALGVSAAIGEEKSIKGSRILVQKFGPWRITKDTYSGGVTVCWAYNHTNRWHFPALVLQYVVGSKSTGPNVSILRSKRNKPKDGENVHLEFGDLAIKLTHPPGISHGSFYPNSAAEASQIFHLIIERENSAKKYFFMRDRRNKRYKIDARSTSKTIDYMNNYCAGK